MLFHPFFAKIKVVLDVGVIELVEEIIIEFLKGIGRFFLHPVTYYLAFFAIAVGWLRVKKERKDFHIRVLDTFEELRKLTPPGLLIGLILSITTLTLGIVFPLGTIVLIAVMTILCSLTLNLRWLSPAYVVGLSFFAIILVQRITIKLDWLHSLKVDLKNTSLPAVVMLLGLLVIAEGVLTFFSKNKETTPVRMKSKRGLVVGAHLANRLWLLPVFLLIPGDVIKIPLDWWPILSIHGETYSLILVPFAVGFSMTTVGMLPKESIRKISANTILLGIMTTMLAVVSIWYPVVSIVAASIAIIGREAIAFRHRVRDDALPFYYSEREQGLVILGIIPASPAEKMALHVGEVIVKVNGNPVKTTEDFYQSLQKNRAYCKLDVLDTNGEIRFAQRALYDGEHHELGILFASEKRNWNHEAI